MKFPFRDFWSRLIVKYWRLPPTNVAPSVVLEGEDYGSKASPCVSRYLPVMSVYAGLPPDIVLSHGPISFCFSAHEITKISDRVKNKVEKDLICSISSSFFFISKNGAVGPAGSPRAASPDLFKRKPDIIYRIIVQ
jgi:hypothetical protein